MDNKKANISQIRKYLNGQLDATAMHKLEREALDDPFLMDALEGYEATGKDQQPNLAELSDRLQKRTQEKKKGRVIPWRTWSIAASILVVLTIGGLWMRKSPAPDLEKRRADVVLNNKAKEPLKDTIALQKAVMPATPLVAQNIKKPVVLKPGARSIYQQEISAGDKATPVTGSESLGNATPVTGEIKEYDKNTSALSEVVVNNYTKSKKLTADTIDLSYGYNAPAKKTTVFGNATPFTSKLEGRVGGLNMEPADPRKHSAIDLVRYAGIIISKDDGMPLIGAAIRVKGTNRSTVTDTKGNFALPAAAAGDKETLDIDYIGYQRTQVSAKAGDSLKVALKPYEGSLSEVVVVKNSNGDEPAYEAAHPEKGWSDFKKYLQTNAVLADGTTGTVSVTFTVNADGSLSDMKVKKSLNTMADQKAMDLLKTGPDWISNSKHAPETVTVKVKFKKGQ